MEISSSCLSISLPLSTQMSPDWTISKAQLLSRAMIFPAAIPGTWTKVAPKGVHSLPVPWKFSPAWASLNSSMASSFWMPSVPATSTFSW